MPGAGRGNIRRLIGRDVYPPPIGLSHRKCLAGVRMLSIWSTASGRLDIRSTCGAATRGRCRRKRSSARKNDFSAAARDQARLQRRIDELERALFGYKPQGLPRTMSSRTVPNRSPFCTGWRRRGAGDALPFVSPKLKSGSESWKSGRSARPAQYRPCSTRQTAWRPLFAAQ